MLPRHTCQRLIAAAETRRERDCAASSKCLRLQCGRWSRPQDKLTAENVSEDRARQAYTILFDVRRAPVATASHPSSRRCAGR